MARGGAARLCEITQVQLAYYTWSVNNNNNNNNNIYLPYFSNNYKLGTVQWTSIPFRGGVVILLVASCWEPCDWLVSHPGGSSNTPSNFPLGSLWWTSIPSRGSSNTPSHFLLGTLWWTSIPSRGSSNTPSHFMLGTLSGCDGLASHLRESSNTPSYFTLVVLFEWAAYMYM